MTSPVPIAKMGESAFGEEVARLIDERLVVDPDMHAPTGVHSNFCVMVKVDSVSSRVAPLTNERRSEAGALPIRRLPVV